MEPGFEICEHCRDLILVGEDELTKALEKGNQTIPQPSNGELWANYKMISTVKSFKKVIRVLMYNSTFFVYF